MNYKNQISDRVKILLIDEDESIFYLIRRVLQRENYRLYTSTSGRSGMEMSTSICPDLILMDTQGQRPVCGSGRLYCQAVS